jgi:hypothetical protein
MSRYFGKFLGKWGMFGSGPDQMITPEGVAVSSDGHVSVADTKNHRIQVFEPTPPQPSTWRVVILAGGGPYAGNNI